jgi:S-DNA-T family DNA segregation ATPase FtsK/SpoIIIE
MRNRPKSNNSKTRAIFYIIVIAVALFILISVFFSHFVNRPIGGIIGSWITNWLVYWFGYCASIIPILLILIGLGQIGLERIRQHILVVIIWLVAIFLFGSYLSFAIGRTASMTNYSGLIGTWFAKIGFTHFGYILTFLIPLFLLYALIPAIRNQEANPYLKNSILVFLLAVLIQLTIAFVFPNGYWQTVSGKQLLIGGSIAKGIIKGLRYLIGLWGTLVVLVCAWAIFVLVYSHVLKIIQPIGKFFKNLFVLLAKGIWWLLKKIFEFITGIVTIKRVQPKPKRDVPITAVEKPEPIIEPTPSLFETPKPAVDKIKKEDKHISKIPVNFDEQEFQNEFLASLDTPPEEKITVDQKALEQEAQLLIEKLKEFDIDCKVTDVLTGPMITRFELEPAPGIKIQRIENLADDLSLSLKAERIRILAPIPGKAVVGIEVPNKYRRIVYLRNILTTDEFTSKTSPLTFALGETITGESYAADLREMPHVLIAGTTGSGKSVCINTMITSIIFRSSHNDVRFLAIDPKQLELPVYNPIPHLLNPTTIDPKHAIKELDRIIAIMEARYGIFANLGVRDIAGYNQIAQKEGLEKKPYIVVIIDELADLMIRAPTEIEEKITRLAQMSRAVGIHLVLATQRPSVDVITGLIKANFPCRIAFQVASKTDSRTILDMNGAEALLGRGDMLFLPPGKGEPIRLHCAFVSAQATKRVVDLWTRRYLTERLTGLVPNASEMARGIISKQVGDVLIDREKASLKRKQDDFYSIVPENIAEQLWAQDYHTMLSEEVDMPKTTKSETPGTEREIDELFDQAARIVFRHREASVSMLQRRLDIGWARAGRIIDQLEQLGIVGPYVGSKSRKVVIQSEEELEKTLVLLKQSPQPSNQNKE